MDKLKRDVQSLAQDEFTMFLAWAYNEERERRLNLNSERAAKVAQIQTLRANGVLATPKDGAEYEIGSVYLPHETATLDGVEWVVSSSEPTSLIPGEGHDWETVEIPIAE